MSILATHLSFYLLFIVLKNKMEVYKFGGASVKNANGVRNILNTILM